MQYWTVQNKLALDTLQQGNTYYPDFSQSDYLRDIPDLNDLYSIFLRAFNNVNFINPDDQRGKGLIFSFYGYDDQAQDLIGPGQILDYVYQHRDAIAALWKTLSKNPDNRLLQVEFDSEFFNPLLLDINDFQILMPPLAPLPPYTAEDFSRIVDSISQGVIPKAILPSHVYQAHLPYLKPENVLNVYDNFAIPELEDYDPFAKPANDDPFANLAGENDPFANPAPDDDAFSNLADDARFENDDDRPAF